MTKQPLAFLFLCLLATLLLVTTASFQQPATSNQPPANSPLPTPTPACNRPASDMPPRPDGCYGGEFPVAPPPQPIPPPCIAAWTVEQLDEDGQPVTELLITVEHPELQRYAPRSWVHLASYGDAWQLVAVDAQVSCGKDEAPLAWATLQILNGGDPGEVLSIYTGPLPADYLDALTPLAREHNARRRVYLPLIVAGDPPGAQADPRSHQ
jgi:hypothetical protein